MLSFKSFLAMSLSVVGTCAICSKVTAEEFYQGKQVSLIVGYGAGGGFDLYARLVAQHLPQHIPGKPTIIVQNMPGASSVKAADYIAYAAIKDGTVLGALGSQLVLNQLVGRRSKYDAREFQWIGRLNSGDSVGLTWHTSDVAKIQDARTASVPMAAGGQTGTAYMIPAALNGLLGTKFTVVLGYQGGAKMALAMESGEVAGTAAYGLAALLNTNENWMRDKKVNLLFITALERHSAIPDVPTLMELGTTRDQTTILRLLTSDSVIGRHYVAPPGTPDERVGLLRQAFNNMTKDSDFIAYASSKNFDINPLDGEKLSAFVDQVMDADSAVIAQAKKLIAPQ